MDLLDPVARSCLPLKQEVPCKLLQTSIKPNSIGPHPLDDVDRLFRSVQRLEGCYVSLRGCCFLIGRVLLLSPFQLLRLDLLSTSVCCRSFPKDLGPRYFLSVYPPVCRDGRSWTVVLDLYPAGLGSVNPVLRSREPSLLHTRKRPSCWGLAPTWNRPSCNS